MDNPAIMWVIAISFAMACKSCGEAPKSYSTRQHVGFSKGSASIRSISKVPGDTCNTLIGPIPKTCFKKPNSDGLQPTSDGLQPNNFDSDGLQPTVNHFFFERVCFQAARKFKVG